MTKRDFQAAEYAAEQAKREPHHSASELGDVIERMHKMIREELYNTKEEDLESRYFIFKWDDKKSIDANICWFAERLDAYRKKAREWEQHHNGHYEVVGRVKKKYLMPVVAKFRERLAQELAK